MSEEYEQHEETEQEQYYTTEQAAKLLGVGTRQFGNICKKEDIQPLPQKWHDGQQHGNLYSAKAIDFQVAKMRETRTELRNRNRAKRHESLVIAPQREELAMLVAQIDQYYQQGVALAEKLGAAREQLGTVTAERDSRITELEALAARLGDTEAERDEARARITELEASQQAGQAPAEKRHPRWMFWK